LINPKDTDELTDQYCAYLDEIVDRLWVLIDLTRSFDDGVTINQYPQIDVDLCVLQLRKSLEVLGFICMLAHRPEIGKFPKRLKKMYSVEVIVKELKKTNKERFPFAVTLGQNDGFKRVSSSLMGPVLGEAEFLHAYGRFCGNRIHAGHSYNRENYELHKSEMSEMREFAYKILSLLVGHIINVNRKYIIFARITGEPGGSSADILRRSY
jgi:hypothetical protein